MGCNFLWCRFVTLFHPWGHFLLVRARVWLGELIPEGRSFSPTSGPSSDGRSQWNTGLSRLPGRRGAPAASFRKPRGAFGLTPCRCVCARIYVHSYESTCGLIQRHDWTIQKAVIMGTGRSPFVSSSSSPQGPGCWGT